MLVLDWEKFSADSILKHFSYFFSRKQVGHFICTPLLSKGIIKMVSSIRRHNEVGSLWAQLLLQFYTDLFETLLVFLAHLSYARDEL